MYRCSSLKIYCLCSLQGAGPLWLYSVLTNPPPAVKCQANIFLFFFYSKKCKHFKSIFFKRWIIMSVLYTTAYQEVKNQILTVLLHLTALTEVFTLNARFSFSLFGACPITSLISFMQWNFNPCFKRSTLCISVLILQVALLSLPAMKVLVSSFLSFRNSTAVSPATLHGFYSFTSPTEIHLYHLGWCGTEGGLKIRACWLKGIGLRPRSCYHTAK